MLGDGMDLYVKSDQSLIMVIMVQTVACDKPKTSLLQSCICLINKKCEVATTLVSVVIPYGFIVDGTVTSPKRTIFVQRVPFNVIHVS